MEKGKGIQINLEGILSICDKPVRVLFDTGASRSFIASDLVSRLNLKLELVNMPLVVSNPVGGSTSLNMACLGVELASHGCLFACNLFVLGFEGFGIILGMDWLEKYGAVLDCDRRTVTLVDEQGRDVVIHCGQESPVIVSYLHSLDLLKEELVTVSITKEYPDIFEEVTGLPPHREIEFRIDLMNYAKPVVLPLRRMAPRE